MRHFLKRRIPIYNFPSLALLASSVPMQSNITLPKKPKTDPGAINNEARYVTSHGLSDLNRSITITSDERGNGGAAHNYKLAVAAPDDTFPILTTYIHFQDGGVKDLGLNGIADEALLSVLIDRLQGFQAGPFACRDNAIALTHLEDALLRLNKRTTDRIARGVEGKAQA